jgi:hypothetical protein
VGANSLSESPLRECRNKLARGIEHLEALNSEIAEFLESKSYSVVREYDVKQSKHLLKFAINTPIPQVRWAMIIGDCVHNARSALDYLAWRLAGSDLADRNTMFPIFLTEQGFNARGLPRIGKLTHEAIAEVRSFQPYTRPNRQESALWTLQELDARDKHKLLTMTHGFAQLAHFSGSQPFPVFLHMPKGGIEHNATIAEIDALPDEKVEVDANLTLDILFERGIISTTDDYEVRGTLEIIFETVNLIITRFENLIATNPHWIK